MRPPVPSRRRDLRLARFAPGVPAAPPPPAAATEPPDGSATGADRFAADVGHFLSQSPRQLPSRYLYDDLGSALFEAICRLPWYPLTRAEMRLLAAHAPEILDREVTSIVELGAGSGLKLAALLRGATRRGALDVHVVDVSGSALAETRRALGGFRDLRVVTHGTTYEAGLGILRATPSARGRRLMLFLGSNLGNFDPQGRDLFLRAMHDALGPGDRLLLGVDLVKPMRALRLAYDDPLGVTAAFNLNLLARIDRELGGDFDLDRFAHHVVWDAERSRIEMHLRSVTAQQVIVPAAGLELALREGETIWTESSYKYEADGVATILGRAGFGVTKQWVDAADRFALTLAEVV
jgi:dimethylhistidine N-methyltransferase